MTDTKVTLGQRLRSLAIDRGKTSPTAALELDRLAQEVDALEELKGVVRAAAPEMTEAATYIGPFREVLVVLDELEAREARR